ncbi:MAG: tetraacyldisaccharide 4'-kinase [Deltaproteobacteria bacterium]|nr:tetraacyldisaccharide 4'-kinase [Deltaproteobacteria bacterium]
MFAPKLIESIWQRQSLWSKLGWVALTPFSLLFSVVARARNLGYDLGLLPVTRAPLTVISIGNLTVGGTGKTPLTLWLAQALQQRGHTVAIVTRGYGGTAVGPTLVGQTGTPLVTPVEVGDEAVMLARRFAGVVIAGRDRAAAAQFAYQRFAADVVLLDDGFQHRRLQRDVDIVLLSARAPTNTWLLPAGPFREPLTSIRRAHTVILSKKTTIQEHSSPSLAERDTQHATRNTQHATRVFHADLVPSALVQTVQGQWHEQPLSDLTGKRSLVVTGIANPQPLYTSLKELGAEVARVVEFPDHHSYTHSEWQKLVQEAEAFDLLLTTEKDLVKLERFSPVPDRLRALRVQLHLEPAEAFLTSIEQRYHSRNEDRTTHGRTISH